MAFSLSNLLKQGVAQANPFDHGQTAATVKKQQQQPVMAQLPSKGQAGFGVMRPGAQIAPQVVNRAPAQIQQPHTTLPQAVGHTLGGFGLGLAHSGIDLAQAGSGLYDFAGHAINHTPSNTTSRFDKTLQHTQDRLDATAKRVEPGQGQAGYKIGNIAGNIAQFVSPGTIVKGATAIPKVASAIEHAAPVIEAAGKTIAPVTKAAAKVGTKLMPGTDAVGRIAGGFVHGAVNPTNLVNAAAMTVNQVGREANQGNTVTKKTVARDFASNVAFGSALEGGSQVAREAIPGIVKGAQATSARIGQAKNNIATQDGITSQQRQLQKEINAHQKQQAALPVTNHTAAEILQRKIDSKTAQIQNLEASRPQQSLPSRLTDKLLTAQPGMSMKDVSKQPRPTAGSATPAPVRPEASAGSQSAPSKGIGEVSLPESTTKVNNGLTQGAKDGRQNLSPETTKLTKGKHDVRNTQNLADTSQANVDALPTNTAIEKAHSMLDQPLGHVNDEQTGFIAKAIEKADTEATKARIAGDTTEADRLTRESADLHNKLSEHAVARGQANQALSMMYNKSPQGLFYNALKDLKKAGVADSPELRGRLQPLIDKVKTAKDFNEKTDALANFHQAVSKEMPQNLGDKAIGIWKAGLLSGVKTQQGNAISNATFGALKKISDVPATAVDKLMSVFTGQRTKALSGRGIGQGTIEGGKNGIHTMKTGIDRRSAGDKYEQHAEIDFKHPVLNKTLGTAVRTVFRGMNAADQPFWYAAFKNSMYDQAKAMGINKGLKGAELTKFMDEAVKNPTDPMANTALREANKSTLNYDTIGSKAVQWMHKGIDMAPGVTPAGAKIAHGALNIVAPFVRVPTAFLSRTIDFTPLGVGKEIFHQVASGKFDQRALSQAIGEGLTGTGAIALGVALTQHNMLSGDYPKNDVKEQQRWKTNQITPNSVKLGGKWISLNYFGPLGLLFNAGNKLETGKGQGAMQQVGTTLGGFGQGLLGQSFLQGLSGFISATQDPGRYANNLINSQAGSLVPSIVNDAANLTDKFQRQADNVGQAVTNRIPGLRQNNPKKQDVYGNPLEQPGGSVKIGGVTLSPSTLVGVKPSIDQTNKNPVTAEVSRLHDVNPDDSALQVTPTPVAGKLTIEGKPVQLSDKQRYDLQKQIGQATQTQWNKLIATPEYKAMDDAGKAKALSNLRSDVASMTQREYVVNNNLGTYSKSATAKEQAVANNKIDMASYTDGTNAIKATPAEQIAKSEADYSKDPTIQKTRNDMLKNLPKGMNGYDVQTLQRFTGLPAAKQQEIFNKEPDAEYKLALANYERDSKLGKISSTDMEKKQGEVFKAQVGAQFPKEVRDVYGMSKDKATAYLANHPQGNGLANAVIAYGDSLAKNGIENNKFVDNKGNVSIVPKGTAIEAASPRITQVAQKNGIPDNIFAALVKQESGGNQGAKSPVGAIGLTQLMPDTARSLGVDPNNADQNLDGGARYLKQMYDKFGRWDYALAAYNAGPGAVEKYHGIPPYTETQNYVKSIMGMVNGGIKGNSLNLVLSDPNAASGGAFNQSGVNTAASSSGPTSPSSIASAFGSTYSSPYKFSKSLRGIAQKASMGSSSTPKTKSYPKAPRAKAYKPVTGLTLKHRKLA